MSSDHCATVTVVVGYHRHHSLAVPHGPRGFLAVRSQEVTVDVRGHADGLMPQGLTDDVERNALGQYETGCRVSSFVGVPVFESGRVADRADTPVEVARNAGHPFRRCEDETRVEPPGASSFSFVTLAPFVLDKSASHRGGQIDGPSAAKRRGFSGDGPSTITLELTSDASHARRPVEVTPHWPQRFASSQSRRQQEGEERFVVLTPQDVEEVAGVVERECDLRCAGSWAGATAWRGCERPGPSAPPDANIGPRRCDCAAPSTARVR